MIQTGFCPYVFELPFSFQWSSAWSKEVCGGNYLSQFTGYSSLSREAKAGTEAKTMEGTANSPVFHSISVYFLIYLLTTYVWVALSYEFNTSTSIISQENVPKVVSDDRSSANEPSSF